MVIDSEQKRAEAKAYEDLRNGKEKPESQRPATFSRRQTEEYAEQFGYEDVPPEALAELMGGKLG